MANIKQTFYHIWQFQNEMGTVDGTQQKWTSRNGYPAFNVMVVMDANYVVRYVPAGYIKHNFKKIHSCTIDYCLHLRFKIEVKV